MTLIVRALSAIACFVTALALGVLLPTGEGFTVGLDDAGSLERAALVMAPAASVTSSTLGSPTCAPRPLAAGLLVQSALLTLTQALGPWALQRASLHHRHQERARLRATPSQGPPRVGRSSRRG